MPEIAVSFAEDLFSTGERANLARQTLFFRIMPVLVVRYNDRSKLAEAQHQWSAKGLQYLTGLANDDEPTTERVFLSELIKDQARVCQEARVAYLGEQWSPGRKNDEAEPESPSTGELASADFLFTSFEQSYDEQEVEKRNQAFWLYELTRDLLFLKTLDESLIDQRALQLCKGGKDLPPFDRTDLAINKEFVLQVASKMPERRPRNFPMNFRSDTPDSRQAKAVLNRYAPVASLLYGISACFMPGAELIGRPSGAFAKNFATFLTKYSEMRHALTVFSQTNERAFRRDGVYSLRLPPAHMEQQLGPQVRKFFSDRPPDMLEEFIAAVAFARQGRRL